MNESKYYNTIKENMFKLAKELWPINRSITGEGIRTSLNIIKNILPKLKIHSMKSGTKVFDWIVPLEWKIKSGWIKKPNGKKICNLKDNNLHVISYSLPVKKKVNLAELKKNLFSLPKMPTAIPYVTSYYKKRWGFCISHKEKLKLNKGIYEVFIDSKLFKGSLNYGELLIKGKSKKEIFLSTYICHPSLANNELSGPVVTTYLAEWVSSIKNRNYSYRIIFIPETIGAISYLSKNIKKMQENIYAGFNISCVGDERTFSYLPSRKGNTITDDVIKHVLKFIYPKFKKYSWHDRGSDERQYCAPLVDLPVASLMRSKYGTFPEWHTSLDTLGNVVTKNGLLGGFNALRLCIEAIENNYYIRTKVKGEPQLAKRSLYPSISTPEVSATKKPKDVNLIMQLLTWADGKHSLLDIAEIINEPIWELYQAVDILKKQKLISLQLFK